MHYKSTVARFSPPAGVRAARRTAASSSVADGHVLQTVVTRAVHAVDTDSATARSSNHVQRAAREADSSRPTHDAASVALKDPPVQYVETAATLRSIVESGTPPSVPTHVPWDPTAHASDAGFHPHTPVEHLADHAARGGRSLREVALDFVRASATVPHGEEVTAPAPTSVPRRRLADGADASATLFDVSPIGLAPGQGLRDVPAQHDRADTFDSGFGPAGAQRIGDDPAPILERYLECAEGIRDPDSGHHKSARCLLDFMARTRDTTGLMELVLAGLEPEAVEELRRTHAHGPAALMAVATAVGTPECQAALCRLLLSIEHETPEVKSYEGAHDFLYVINAISELVDPTPATIDALHRSLEQHEDHPDQYHQVLLALGGLGRMLDRGHPQQERIRATLEHRFDRALAANQETETRFLRHLDRARDLIESMPTEEWHMWMLRANHVDRREWAETWDTATPLDRQEYERHTTEVIARILAGAEGEDDGYGLKHDYSRPARRLAGTSSRPRHWGEDAGVVPPEPTQQYIPRSEGHNDALGDVLTMQAAELRYAVQALANLGHPASTPRVLSITSHRKLAVRAFAVHALHALPSPEVRRVLLSVAADESEDTLLRASAIDALGSWPDEHLRADGAVLDHALRHLAANDGVEWRQCEVDCAASCATRSIAHCQRTCARKCQTQGELEKAVVSLLHHRWGQSALDFTSDREMEAQARRLAGQVHGDDGAVAEHHVRGARRLFKVLEELEKIFTNTKFDFRDGFQQDWKLSVGKKSIIGAFAGAGLKNIIEMNVGLFAGFFAIDLDNWAAVRLYIFGFSLDFLDAKVAFTAGVSYTNKLAGQMLANAQATLGNVIAMARSLPGRAIGYIMEFRERLDEISGRVNEYMGYAEKFIAMASSYGDVGEVVQAFALHGLELLEANVTSMIAKYDIVSTVKKLANDAYDDSIGLLTSPDSPLTKVLNFIEDLEGFLAEIAAFRDMLQDTFSMITGRFLQFPHQIRQSVAVVMRPIRQVVEGLELLETARVKMGEQVHSTLDMIQETCDFEPMVEDLVATHVQNYTALLGPVQEQIVQVRTVVETINEMVSSGGLGVDTMRTTLLSYMRSLVPDAKAAILGEGTKSAGALQGTAAGRLGAVLGTFNSSAAGDASQASADSALSGIPALLDTVKSVGTDAAAFLDGGGSGSPLELALAAVREGVASASGDVLGDLESVVSEFVSGFTDSNSPVGAASGSTEAIIGDTLATLGRDVLPVAMDAVAQRLRALTDSSLGDSADRLIATFVALQGLWEQSQAHFSALMLPPVASGEADSAQAWAAGQPLPTVDGAQPPSVWTTALAETATKLLNVADPFLGEIASRATGRLHEMTGIAPRLDRGVFGATLQGIIRSAAEDAAHTLWEEAQAGAMGEARAVWADVVATIRDIGTPDLVSELITRANAVGDELAITLGKTAIRSVITSFDTALAALATEELEALEKEVPLPPETIARKSDFKRLFDALVAVRTHVLEVGISATWLQDFISNDAAAKLVAATDDLLELAPAIIGADDPAADAYFPKGMAGVRAKMPVASIVEAAMRVRMIAEAMHPLAWTLQRLLEGGGVVGLTGRDPRLVAENTVVTQVPDVELVTDIVSTLDEAVAQPLRLAHANITTQLAALLQTVETGRGVVSAMVTKAQACAGALASKETTPGLLRYTDTEEYAAVRDLFAAAKYVVGHVKHGSLTPTHARELLVAAAKVADLLRTTQTVFGSFQSCGQLSAVVDAAISPATTRLALVVDQLYSTASRVNFAGALALFREVTESSDAPVDVLLAKAEDFAATQLSVATGAAGGYAASWFARSMSELLPLASQLGQAVKDTRYTRGRASLKELRENPLHEKTEAAMDCILEASDAFLAAVPTADDVDPVKSIQDIEELASYAQREFVATLDKVLADLPTCLEGADPVDADGVLEQFCFDVSIDVTVPRERCMEVPSVSFNGTETGGTETACSQVLVTEVEVVQECHDYVTLDRSYEMVNARPASDLVAKYTEPASTLVSRVRTLLRSKQLQPLLKAVRTGLQVASLLWWLLTCIRGTLTSCVCVARLRSCVCLRPSV